MLKAVKADIATTMIRPGEFTHPSGGLTVFAQAEDENGVIKNLFIDKATERLVDHLHGRGGAGRQAQRRPVMARGDRRP